MAGLGLHRDLGSDPYREVVALGAHRLRDHADTHQRREDLAADAVRERRLEQGRHRDHGHEPASKVTASNPKAATTAVTLNAVPTPCAKRFGGPGTSRATKRKSGRDDTCDQLTEGTQCRSRQDPGDEPIRERYQQPTPASGDKDHALDEHPCRDTRRADTSFTGFGNANSFRITREPKGPIPTRQLNFQLTRRSCSRYSRPFVT